MHPLVTSVQASPWDNYPMRPRSAVPNVSYHTQEMKPNSQQQQQFNLGSFDPLSGYGAQSISPKSSAPRSAPGSAPGSAPPSAGAIGTLSLQSGNTNGFGLNTGLPQPQTINANLGTNMAANLTSLGNLNNSLNNGLNNLNNGLPAGLGGSSLGGLNNLNNLNNLNTLNGGLGGNTLGGNSLNSGIGGTLGSIGSSPISPISPLHSTSANTSQITNSMTNSNAAAAPNASSAGWDSSANDSSQNIVNNIIHTANGSTNNNSGSNSNPGSGSSTGNSTNSASSTGTNTSSSTGTSSSGGTSSSANGSINTVNTLNNTLNNQLAQQNNHNNGSGSSLGSNSSQNASQNVSQNVSQNASQNVSPGTASNPNQIQQHPGSVVGSRAPSLSSLALPVLNSHINAFQDVDQPSQANQAANQPPASSMWLNEDSAKLSRPALAVLNVVNLPRDLTLREAQFIFALASDLLSVDVSRNAVSGDVSISARFMNTHSAQVVGMALERRPDIFGQDVKTSVQSFAQSFAPQQQQRSIYQQRPLFSADSTWSQQPISPLTPATNEILNTQRRSSSLVAVEQLNQLNISAAQPSHQAYEGQQGLRSTPPSISPHGSVSNPDAHKIPPPNPADQNPPCNTLYVGNLPPDTSETELKELFSRQPGYRRLCFRTKQNGPMCFVEFEDEVYAGKTLVELYGVALSNSVKGGIRLSYSKNPLGVKSRAPRAKNIH